MNDSFENIEAQPYPLDFDALQKGDYIAPETVERITGVNRDSAHYSLKIMGLIASITERLAEREIPLHVVVRQENRGIRIEQDWPASAYVYSEAERARRSIARNYARLAQAVDSAEFDACQRRQHENRLLVVGSMLRGLREGRKAALLEIKQRPEIPPMLEAKNTDATSIA